MTESVQERRKHPRVRLGRVEIRSYENSDEVCYNCDAENLSVGGLCVRLQKRLELFTGVMIRLYFEDMPQAIECKGKINWTMMLNADAAADAGTYETGIQFIKLPDTDKLTINREIKNLLSNSHN